MPIKGGLLAEQIFYFFFRLYGPSNSTLIDYVVSVKAMKFSNNSSFIDIPQILIGIASLHFLTPLF